MNIEQTETTHAPSAGILRSSITLLVVLLLLAFFVWRSDVPHPWRNFVEGTVVLIASIASLALAKRFLTKRGWTTEKQKKLFAIGLGILALVILITNVVGLLWS